MTHRNLLIMHIYFQKTFETEQRNTIMGYLYANKPLQKISSIKSCFVFVIKKVPDSSGILFYQGHVIRI
jgi:hypothetical protein